MYAYSRSTGVIPFRLSTIINLMAFTHASNFEVLLTPTVKRSVGMGDKVKRES